MFIVFTSRQNYCQCCGQYITLYSILIDVDIINYS